MQNFPQRSDVAPVPEPFHIVLVEPEIPPNTGNVARTCAATGAHLHLVRPLGFDISDSAVKRAGLDYWQHMDLTVHESLADFLTWCEDRPTFFVETQGVTHYSDVRFVPGSVIVFGKETKGLPKDLVAANMDRTIRIPMRETLRSLNLGNCVSIVLYEALRQTGFQGLR
jgi:tRNA (cytidine/uridine-2'-O-)-methyltransferase